MKIGIYVHSLTGNTYSVAEKMQAKLTECGNSAEIVRIETVGTENTNEAIPANIELKPVADAAGFDMLIFAAPVRAFSISPVLKAYFKKSGPLDGKKVALFVTEQLPFPWMGGNHAIRQMKSECTAKGAAVIATGIVNWSNKKREAMIETVTEKICGAMK